MENFEWLQYLPSCNRVLLRMIYPEFESKQEIDLENEQMNAIGQANGRYTLIPQMYGGITSAEQLSKIADIAVKYDIQQIAITSEQRIHLMDVKKKFYQLLVLT